MIEILTETVIKGEPFIYFVFFCTCVHTTFHEDSLLCDRVRPLFLGLCDLVCIDYFHSPYVKVQFKYDSTGLKEKIHRMETVRSFWDCSVLVFL